MALFEKSGSGEGSFIPYVKYNAKAGRWYTKKDEQDAPEFEVTDMTGIFDMDNLQTGWFLFAAGVAPVKNFDPSLAQAAAKPGEGFQRGFQVHVFSPKNLLGVREFSSTAGVVKDAISELHEAWEQQCGANPGKLPIVKCTGVLPVTNKHGTNFQPCFQIVGWADRPAELAGNAAPAPAQATSAPPPAAATHAPPPAAAPAPADADAVDF